MCFKKLAAWVSSRSRMQHFSCDRSVPSFQTRDSRAHISSASSALHGDDNINGDSLTRVSVACRARRYGAGSGRNLGRRLGRPRRGPPNGSQIYVDYVLALFSASPPLPILVLLPYPCITQGLVFLKQKETSLRSICIFINPPMICAQTPSESLDRLTGPQNSFARWERPLDNPRQSLSCLLLARELQPFILRLDILLHL